MNNETSRQLVLGSVFKSLLSLFVIIIFPVSLYAQYMPAVVEGNHTVVTAGTGLGTYVDRDYVIYCDTILNGKDYKIVWRNGSELFGFVREDTLQKEVYYLGKDSVAEMLVTKYGLKVGDTFHYSSYPHLYVDSIYTDFRFGRNRTIWRGNISGAFGFCETIEGIGVNQWGIIPKIPNLVGYVTLFENTNNTCSTLSVKENAAIKPTVYPNPATNRLEVIFPETVLFPIAIELYDISGRKCITQSGIRQSNVQLDLSVLSPGGYILRFQNSQSSQSVLVIKQ